MLAPDGRIDQRLELKQLTTSNPSKIATRIKEALVKQGAENVIIDLRNSRLSNVQAISGLREAIRKQFVGPGQTVRLITRNGLELTLSR